MDLIQKARVKWDIEGDENTKLFHGLINRKRRNQMINGLPNAFADAVGNGLISGNILFNYLGHPIGSNMKSLPAGRYNMSRDVLTIGSTMRIPLLYREEYSQWVKRFMNYLEEQTGEEAMINSIKNGDQP
nr:RNA-directed DNA polymerase, eukaryota, reverse transcriptase zinc-binding domain protein [Tanacetum cinerariifolium]